MTAWTGSLQRLREASEAIAKATTDRDQAIIAARAAGATWEQVLDAAQMSRAGVIKAYNRARARDEG